MLEGLDVILEGITGQNTEGIARKVKAVYSTEEGKAYALFNNILPGNYDIRGDDSVEKSVPIEVDGKKIYDGAYGGPLDKQFTVRLRPGDLYAENDKNTDVTLQWREKKSCGLSVLGGGRKIWMCESPVCGCAGRRQKCGIRLSEYMTPAFPTRKAASGGYGASGNYSVDCCPACTGWWLGHVDYWVQIRH
jgi:hypothetical protein